MRGLKHENFWVIETQPGFVNWSDLNNSLDKGEVRAMAWHDVGHGADEVGYWQWRSAYNGQEEIHGTLVGADGEPVPLLEEVAQTAKEFAAARARSVVRRLLPKSRFSMTTRAAGRLIRRSTRRSTTSSQS